MLVLTSSRSGWLYELLTELINHIFYWCNPSTCGGGKLGIPFPRIVMDSLALLLSRVSGKSRAKFLNLPLPHAVPPTVPLFSTWATTSKDLAIQSLAWHSQMFHLFPVFFWFGAIKILISAKNVQFATSPHSQKTKSRFNTNSHNHNRIFFRVSDNNLNLSSSYDGFILVRTV